MDSDPRCDVLHGCIQQVRTHNLEIRGKGRVSGAASVSTATRDPLLGSPLTGNLLNRSVNICVDRGLFRRLMKELRAFLKTSVTRSTSKLPVKLNCVGKQQELNPRPTNTG